MIIILTRQENIIQSQCEFLFRCHPKCIGKLFVLCPAKTFNICDLGYIQMHLKLVNIQGEKLLEMSPNTRVVLGLRCKDIPIHADASTISPM